MKLKDAISYLATGRAYKHGDVHTNTIITRSNVCLFQITSVRRHLVVAETVTVEFIVILDGHVVSAAEAVAVFSHLAEAELGDFLRYQVGHFVYVGNVVVFSW